MDTIIGFFQSLTGTEITRLLFVVAAGAISFMLALGISILVIAAADPVRRRLGRLAGEVEPEHKAVAH